MTKRTRACSIGALTFCLLFAASSAASAHARAPGPDSRAVSVEPQNPAAQPSAEAVPLEVGKPVEREMKGGEAHSYSVRLDAGQYLHAVADQHGVDVVVTLFGPGGAKLVELDRPTSADGPEPVSWVAETAGTYRVGVQAPDARAPAGRYEIRLLEVRAATESDRVLVEAQSLGAQATTLAAGGKVGDAVPLAERAAALYEKALGPDHPDVAQSLDNLGLFYYALRQSAKAEPLILRALAIHEKAFGPDHPVVSVDLNNLTAVYIGLRQYAKAEPLMVRSLAIQEKSLGPDHPDIAVIDSNLAAVYAALRQEAKAEPLYLRALAINEKTLGPESPEVAATLNNLASLYRNQGQYPKAAPMYERALAIREKVYGPEHALVAASLNNLGSTYANQGQYAKAEPLYARSLAVYEKLLGPDHPDVALALNNLADLYNTEGRYAKAEPLLARALAIREKALGPDDPLVATALNNLATISTYRGQYAKAEPLFERSLAIRQKAFGSESPEAALALNNIASVYEHQGLYAKAEPLFARALAIAEKALGPEHPTVAATVNNLGDVYRDEGQYAKAELLYARALAIREKALGPDHPDVAASLNNLANLYRSLGQQAKAEPLLVRALAIYEKALGPDHALVATGLNNLALVYRAEAQDAKAEPLYVRAIAIHEKALGPNHPDVANDYNNLAWLYADQGQYDKAKSLFERALAIREKALGPDHPDVATTLTNLAALHFAASDFDEALRLQARAGDAREAELRRNLVAGSEAEKRLYLAQTQTETDVALSIQAACGPANADALRVGLTAVLRRKGRALDALVDQLGALARSGSADDRRLLDELARARADYAALTLRGPGREGVEQHGLDLADASGRVDELEAQASARSSRVRAELAPVTFDAIRAAVPKGATLVEFATYHPYLPKAHTYGTTRYVVFTLAEDGMARWADLGEAAPIDAAVVALREVLRAREDGTLSRTDRDVKPRARALDALVFATVRALAGESRRLLVAPEGQLSLVPFDALVDERGRYETESYEISYLTSGRDLLRLAARGESREAPAVFANPDFGGPASGAAEGRLLVVEKESQQQPSASAVSLLARAYFGPLPGTAAEAKALPAFLPGARVLTGAAATKQAVIALSGPRVLHLATHGFFLAGAREAAAPGAPTKAPTDAEDPLLRSGLAFAGANLHQGGDAILTSAEAAGLDLWGTKLVVLSACDTGIGDVRNGDGVYGLRRALVLAGSETQVMSLWPVSDRGTRDLMIGFYRRLATGEGRSAAMRDVRLAMLKDPKRRHPYYWASFIVSGEWANLDGQR